MKERPHRHKATNTFTFQGFGEKVRALRVSARKFLLQRPQTEDGENITIFYQTLVKYRDLDLTEAFQAFQNDLGSNIQTTVQLVHQEEHVAKCLADHLAIPSSMALQSLLDLTVAFANDIPHEFYQRHFYNFLSALMVHLSTKDPEQIEIVFLCIVSLFVVLQKYLCNDLYELYHVHNYATLLSKAHPWYINELAAQSLRFLLRKLPKKDTFLGMALRKLKKDESQVQGVGRLMAAMMKSDVVQRLQSSTSQILSELLDLLGDENVPPGPALEAVSYAVENMAGYVTSQQPDKSIRWQTTWQEDASMVWPTLMNSVKFLLPHAQSSEVSCHHLHAVLQVVQVLVSYKHGSLLTDIPDMLKQFTSVIQTPLPDDIGSTVFNMVAIVLATTHHQVTRTAVDQTVSVLLASSYSYMIKFDFVKQVVPLTSFDTDILPLVIQLMNDLVRTSEGESVKKDVLSMIASLVFCKQPPCGTGKDLYTWKKYLLDFTQILATADSVDNKSIPSIIEHKISKGLKEDFSNLEELLLCLSCVPHVSPLDYQDLAPYLVWILSDAVEMLDDKTEKVINDDKTVFPKKKGNSKMDIADFATKFNIKLDIPLNTRRILFLLGVLIEAMAHVLTGKDFLASLSQLQVIKVLKQKPQYRENIHILRAIDLHFTVASTEEDPSIMNENFLGEIYATLAPALASACPRVRLLVTHIFSLFPVTLPPLPENLAHTENMFQIMLKAESLAVTPWEYKDRLRFTCMLDADHVMHYQPVCGTYSHAPLFFFLGQLYINYKDIWSPVLNGISSYAHTMPENSFWPIWFSKLKIAGYAAKKVLQGNPVDPEKDIHFENTVLNDIVHYLSSHPGFTKVPLQPDYFNYRDLLWNAMEKFPDVCEAKSRDLVPMFFKFIEEELFPADFTIAPTQDLSVEGADTTTDCEDLNGQSVEEELIGTENRKTDTSLVQEVKNYHSPLRRAPIKSLCEQLAVFSKFHNPKMLFQTKKLQRMYQDFLSHPSPALQKLAFKCIMTYNHPYLIPYKESLSSILDDKSFKNALTLFSIDGSEQSVQEEHRKDLMPYLMRILYGKMHFKTGANSSGKAKVSVRKGIVLRFLAGARESELSTFLELAFDVLMSHLDGTALDIVIRSRHSFNIQNVVPLSRLQGALTTLESIIENIGNLLVDKVPFLLKVIVYIVNLVSLLLEKRAEISERNISFLKRLRQKAQRQLVAFFERYEEYCWSSDELDAVFHALVWPNLRRLPDEGISTPTPLLGLFHCWAENPRYFSLLAKCHEEDSSLTPLPYIVKLLNHEKCGRTVTDVILNIIEKLLSLEDYHAASNEEGKLLKPIPVGSHFVHVEKLYSRDGRCQQNYGTALLVPHLDAILQSMKKLVTQLGKSQNVLPRDLNILTSLTEWVTSKDVSDDLLSLIVPLIVKKHIKKEEKISQLLKTCSHLLVVDDTVKYLRPLITQFGCLESRQARDALCQAVNAISSVHPQYKNLADMAGDLNSWNLRMVDEVDFERRLGGYERLTTYCQTQISLDVDFCQFLVYNNIHVICHEEDSSLKDMSSLCLTHAIDMFARLQSAQPVEFKQIVVDTLLPLVRHGLQIEKEAVRIEIISILRHAVHKCHPYSDRLMDLHKLADETEEDLDFFSNMGHIQRHRRARAMGRLADKLNNGDLTFRKETLTDYLMPMVTVYLFKEVYATDDFLTASSVSCVGAFAKLLPWYSYQKVLRNYLSILLKEDLKYLKLGVRVIDAVLNGFHEDAEEPEFAVRKNPVKDNNEDTQKAQKDEQDVTKSEREMSEEHKETEEDAEGYIKSVTVNDHTISKPQKVYRLLVSTIIPQIQKTLAARTKADTDHKLNKSKYPEDDDIKRIPLAFALIKLLKKLPKKVLDANVNSVLMKIITFLKSKAQSIRVESRNMLVKIMGELGGEYLPWLVRDLQSILTSGFQAHVLVYTLHSVLSNLRSVLTSEHVDACMAQMVDICKEDILGIQAEEKNIGQITSKTREARSSRGYDILSFTAEFISTERLRDIILPLKDILTGTQDRKIISKMVRCLNEISNGLERNGNISLTQKSIFIYGILNERLPDITYDKSVERVTKKTNIQKPDSFLLLPEPKRTRINPKTSFKATAHVLIEFALLLLCKLMRREKLIPKEVEHQQLLDPYVSVMTQCINSEYPEVSVQALKCINWLIKFPLPSLREQLKIICGQMFVILNKFSSSELVKGKVHDLVQLSFKTLASIIKTVKFYMLTEEEVIVLLQYVKGSLEDNSQQQTAFIVLQAIIARKIDAFEVHELMEHVQEMSITSSRQYALQQARITYYTYLITYPMKPKKITSKILYFIGNVSYALEEGRVSATTMINEIVTNFPAKLFTKNIEANLWLSLSEQQIKEESKENQLLLHKTLKTLFLRSVRKELLIELCMKLLHDGRTVSDLVAIQLAAKALDAFLDVPVKQLPYSLLSTVTPQVIKLISPSRYSTQLSIDNQQDDCGDDTNIYLQHLDTTLSALLLVLTKLVDAFLSHPKWSKHVTESMWDYVQAHLRYPHIQVRLSGANLIGRLLAAYPVEGETSPSLVATTDKARSLALDLCELLQTQASVNISLLTQISLSVVRNLIYLIRHSCKVSLVKSKDFPEKVFASNNIEGENVQDKCTVQGKDSVVLSASWVIRRIGNMAYEELQKSGKNYTLVREALLNLMAGMIVIAEDKVKAPTLLTYMIKHLARELSDEHVPESLATRTREVATLVKKLVGIEIYTRHLTAAQVVLSKKRLERRARDHQQYALNPRLAMKRKRKKQESSKESKRRKIANAKGRVMKKKTKKLKDHVVVME
ncbi:small subunit processome component 20 homolog [Panulirus ornatus]|uniref:small subunit processome component 20 homolog n=1 Tax=Panulirus ornatus TaxID=150431 RepID=UPI003A83D33F